ICIVVISSGFGFEIRGFTRNGAWVQSVFPRKYRRRCIPAIFCWLNIQSRLERCLLIDDLPGVGRQTTYDSCERGMRTVFGIAEFIFAFRNGIKQQIVFGLVGVVFFGFVKLEQYFSIEIFDFAISEMNSSLRSGN